MIVARLPDDPALQRLLQRHPFVEISGEPTGNLQWQEASGWQRLVRSTQSVGFPELGGLVELIDNNPMVCADSFGVPGPSATLATLALGPLIRAGLIREQPALVFSFVPDQADIELHLSLIGEAPSPVLAFEDRADDRVHALSAMVEVAALADWTQYDELYEEAYGRSFFARLVDASGWDTTLVAGQHHAVIDLSLTPGEDDVSLLTIKVMADRDGKCGASQMIHAMNVMAGFEESAGLDQPLSTS